MNGRRRIGWLWICFSCFMGILVCAVQLTAQPPSGQAEATDQQAALKIEFVQERIDALDSSSLSDETKQDIRKILEQAKTELTSELQWQQKAQGWQADIDGAGPAKSGAQAALRAPDPPAALTADLTKDQLEAALTKSKAELAEASKDFQRWESEPARRAARRTEIPKLVGQLKDGLEELQKQLTSQPPSSDPVVVATELRLRAQRQRTLAQITALEKEQGRIEAETELLPLRGSVAARNERRLEGDVQALQDRIRELKEIEAARQAQTAAENAELNRHSAMREILNENVQLAAKRQQLLKEIVLTEEKLKDVADLDKQVQDDHRDTYNRVQRVGLTHAIGAYLQKQKAGLPDRHKYQQQQGQLRIQVRDVQLELFDLDEKWRKLSDLQVEARNEAYKMLAEDSTVALDEMTSRVEQALADRREIVNDLRNDTNKLFENLVDLDTRRQQMITNVEKFEAYIDEHILWVRSLEPLWQSDFSTFGAGLIWLLHPANGPLLARAALGDARGHLPLYGVMLVGLITLVVFQQYMRREIGELGEQTARRGNLQFAPSLKAFIFTLLIAGCWPAWLGLLAWRLFDLAAQSSVIPALADGLWAAASVLFWIELARQACRARGLGEAHFGWSTRTTALARRHLRWFTWFGVPLCGLAAVYGSAAEPSWNGTLGRLAFVAAMLMLALLIQRLVRPQGGVFQQYLAFHPGGWVDRLRYLWYPLAVLLPVTLAILAICGYVYTAQQLAWRSQMTARLMIGCLLLGSLFMHWMLVGRRKLAIQQRRERAAQEQPSTDGLEGLPAEESLVDLEEIKAQTQRLLQGGLVLAILLGLGIVWHDVLPALRFLERIRLWTMAGIEPGTKIQITLADAALVVPIVIMTWVGARNIPGLLEIALVRLPLDSAIRYAIRTLARYAIVIVGILWISGTLGITWSKAQWLVAALGVGLGFGLQEIFANFVSGLIILFERPIRVGDIVTVGTTTGRVTRIRMRATTITDWDRKELIVPNKDLITSSLVNWTLSDHINRLVFTVGVAYGTDTVRASKLLREVADDHPDVLADPPPLVTFSELGDSTLNLVMRVYLSSLDARLSTLHDLHTTIHKVFAEEGITIAFPQLDVHFSAPLPSPLDRNGDSANSKDGAGRDVGVTPAD